MIRMFNKTKAERAENKYDKLLTNVQNIASEYQNLNPEEFGKSAGKIVVEMTDSSKSAEYKKYASKAEERIWDSSFGMLLGTSYMRALLFANAISLDKEPKNQQKIIGYAHVAFMLIEGAKITFNQVHKQNDPFSQGIALQSLELARTVYQILFERGAVSPKIFEDLAEFKFKNQKTRSMKRELFKEGPDSLFRAFDQEFESRMEELLTKYDEGKQITGWIASFTKALTYECMPFTFKLEGMNFDDAQVAIRKSEEKSDQIIKEAKRHS